METEAKKHILTLHFEKPIDRLSAKEIDSIWQRAKEWAREHNCERIVLQTSKKQKYQILNLICAKKPILKK